MPRKTIGVLMLAGITLSGAVGGQLMRAGARMPRERVSAPRSAQQRPVPAAPIAARHAVSGHRDTPRDVFALAGD